MENISSYQIQNPEISLNDKYFSPLLKIMAFIILLGFFIISAFYFISGKTRNYSKTIQYIDKSNGFIIDYPVGWEIDKSFEKSVLFKNPIPDVLISQFLFSAFLEVDYNGDGATINELENWYINTQSKDESISNFKIENEEDVPLLNEEGRIIIMSFIFKKKIKAKAIVYFLTSKEKKKDFIITGFSPDETWVQYEKIFKKCLKSMRLTN